MEQFDKCWEINISHVSSQLLWKLILEFAGNSPDNSRRPPNSPTPTFRATCSEHTVGNRFSTFPNFCRIPWDRRCKGATTSQSSALLYARCEPRPRQGNVAMRHGRTSCDCPRIWVPDLHPDAPPINDAPFRPHPPLTNRRQWPPRRRRSLDPSTQCCAAWVGHRSAASAQPRCRGT